MKPLQTDLSIFKKFNFEKPPVGVKFSLTIPDGIDRIDKRLNFCEMVPEAQEGKAFYAGKGDITCVGSLYLGMVEREAVFESGRVGPKMKVFNDPRVNQKIYKVIARLPKGSVKYVVFAPLDEITFNPDLLIISADPVQAGILLRATSYYSLNMWTSVMAPVVECNWVYIYPYVTGEIYYQAVFSPGFGLGRIPPGQILITLPYDVLPMLMNNLREIEWELPLDKIAGKSLNQFKDEMEKICEEVAAEIGEERDSSMLP